GDFPASILTVHHFPPSATSVLPMILQRKGKLPAVHPTDGEELKPGKIYVAPPDLHMTLNGGSIRLSHRPRGNRHRPAIDVLFRSAARFYGRRAIGVVLSGFRDDGTAGLYSIKRAGGMAIVQDPEDALFDFMPRSAIAVVDVDHVLPTASI